MGYNHFNISLDIKISGFEITPWGIKSLSAMYFIKLPENYFPTIQKGNTILQTYWFGFCINKKDIWITWEIKHTLYLRYPFLSWLTCYFVLIPPVIQPAKNTSQLIIKFKTFYVHQHSNPRLNYKNKWWRQRKLLAQRLTSGALSATLGLISIKWFRWLLFSIGSSTWGRNLKM